MRFSTFRMGWRNLGRNRKRTAFALLAIAVGQFAFLAMAGMMNGWKDEILNAITGPAVGDVQIHVPGWRAKRSIDVAIGHLDATLAEIRADPLVESVFPRLFSPALAAPARQAHMAYLIGLDAESESAQRGLLRGLATSLGNRRVFVGRIAAEKMKFDVEGRRRALKEGDQIALIGQDADGFIANNLFTVAAIGMTQLDSVNRRGVVMSLADAQEFLGLGDQAHEVVVHAKSRADIDGLAARLRAAPSLEGCEVMTWRQLVPQAAEMLEMIDFMTLFVLVFVFIAAVAGIVNTMFMSTFERFREIGMLLALGVRPARIVRMVLTEAAALGLAGAAVGTALGGGLVWLYSCIGLDFAAMGGETAENFAMEGMRLPLLVYPWLKHSDVVTGVVSVVVMSVVAAVLPAVVASRFEPVEALRD